MSNEKHGFLAEEFGGEKLPLQVCKSGAGFYLGTTTAEGEPNTRESAEYWPNRRDADAALNGRKMWTQRHHL